MTRGFGEISSIRIENSIFIKKVYLLKCISSM